LRSKHRHGAPINTAQLFRFSQPPDFSNLISKKKKRRNQSTKKRPNTQTDRPQAAIKV
jgi:hypothetical protein